MGLAILCARMPHLGADSYALAGLLKGYQQSLNSNQDATDRDRQVKSAPTVRVKYLAPRERP